MVGTATDKVPVTPDLGLEGRACLVIVDRAHPRLAPRELELRSRGTSWSLTPLLLHREGVANRVIWVIDAIMDPEAAKQAAGSLR